VAGGEYLIIALCFGLAAGFVARGKASSFWIWFIIGAVLPVLGLVGAILYRGEQREPERVCPRCGAVQKLYVQVCTRCGEDLYLPDPGEVRHPG
jgi:uncharacterized paraquat-inducible protein A